jgi:hypothetical protein
MRYLRTVSALCAILSLGGAASSWAQPEGEPVHVTNFPEVQQITGRVVVSEPIPQSRFETVKAVVAPFALRAEAEVTTPLGGFFSSASTAHRLAFSRYRVFLYDTTAKSAEALIYAYMSGS